ncbi:hypothetical protein LCGC14_0741060 [marine sediment metagenome]|uniref:Uncharacterized protein n=1 Tax=marine sediment metagenome TaxID=412755 RepID=A0A0F9SRL7_9ZZZZ
MNYLKRHPNIMLTVFHFIVGTAVNLILARAVTTGAVYYTIGIGSVIVSLAVTAWFLRVKGRPMWFLFLAVLSWIGFALLLYLENKNETKGRIG